MRNKKNKNTEQKKPAAENYYNLKTDAVERLANADKKTYAEPKTDPGKQYRSSAIDRIPSWIKALFIKFWFNGAVCFFIFWGLGLYINSMENMILVMAVVLGIVTDILVNNAFRFFERYEGQNSKWMMFPQKKFWTFFVNIIYAFVILLGVIWFYNIFNGVANSLKGTENQIYLGVEPIVFGLSYMVIDLFFIGIKNLIVSIVSDAKQKNGI